MKIRGNTVGTPIKPKNVLVKSENLTPEEQALARQNIGAMQNGVADTDLDMQHHNLKNVTEITLDFGMSSSVTMSNFMDEGPRVHFGSRVNDVLEKVGLSNIADGKRDNDAATVGQLKAAVNPINDAVKDIIALMDDFNQDLGDILQEVQNAGAVKMIDNQDSTAKVSLYDLENGVYVLKGYFKANNSNSPENNTNISISSTLLAIVSGTTDAKKITLLTGSGDVARYDITAESYKAYPRRNLLSEADDFELLAETILTEDVSEILWTQGTNGEPLTDYKDFFIYWVGKFDKDVSNEAIMCRANGGVMYFGYTTLNKSSQNPQGFWWNIEEFHKDDSNVLWKFRLPAALMTGYAGSNTDYIHQGTMPAAQYVKEGICYQPASKVIENLRIGSPSTGAKMVAGSKALLFGRKR